MEQIYNDRGLSIKLLFEPHLPIRKREEPRRTYRATSLRGIFSHEIVHGG